MKINFCFYLFLATFGLSLSYSCKKEPVKVIPTITVEAVVDFTAISATCIGDITSDGGETVTDRGFCYSTDQNPTIANNKTSEGTGIGSFSRLVTGLSPATTYNVKAYAINSIGVGYSNKTTFTTLALAPILITSNLSDVTTTSANCGGNITNDGGAAITGRGICWSKSQNPTTDNSKTTDGSGIGSFISILVGLEVSTTYYLRAYAINSIGTAYGNEVVLKTLDVVDETVTDIDGNVYHTIKLGTQIWTLEDLSVTRFNDGTNIPNVTDGAAWKSLSTAAFCWYNNDLSGHKQTYGALYNWYSVNTGKLAPIGWKVPSDEDWTILINYLGGENVAGGKMKEIGIIHWNSPNTNATNESNFTSLPSGYRSNLDGKYYDLGRYAHYWSTTSYDENTAWLRTLIYSAGNIYRYDLFNKRMGFSVRCVKMN